MASMTWNAAVELQNRTQAAKDEKHDDAAAKLTAALQEMAVQPECTIVNAKPFYSAQMHCRAAMQNCNRKELERIIKVAQEMLEPIKAIEDAESKLHSDMSKVRALYREDNCGCETFIEFLQKLAEK